jgi:hypothetical protein
VSQAGALGAVGVAYAGSFGGLAQPVRAMAKKSETAYFKPS